MRAAGRRPFVVLVLLVLCVVAWSGPPARGQQRARRARPAKGKAASPARAKGTTAKRAKKRSLRRPARKRGRGKGRRLRRQRQRQRTRDKSQRKRTRPATFRRNGRAGKRGAASWRKRKESAGSRTRSPSGSRAKKRSANAWRSRTPAAKRGLKRRASKAAKAVRSKARSARKRASKAAKAVRSKARGARRQASKAAKAVRSRARAARRGAKRRVAKAAKAVRAKKRAAKERFARVGLGRKARIGQDVSTLGLVVDGARKLARLGPTARVLAPLAGLSAFGLAASSAVQFQQADSLGGRADALHGIAWGGQGLVEVAAQFVKTSASRTAQAIASLGVLGGSIQAGVGLYNVASGARKGDWSRAKLGLLDTGAGVSWAASSLAPTNPVLLGSFLSFALGRTVYANRGAISRGATRAADAVKKRFGALKQRFSRTGSSADGPVVKPLREGPASDGPVVTPLRE